jgi:hypothetical protein
MSERVATGRLVKVSLRDVPIEIRRREGAKLIDQISRRSGGDVFSYLQVIDEVAALQAAIEEPNGDVQWISAEAVREVLGWELMA